MDYEKRNRAIVRRLRDPEKSLQDIADEYDLSRERVRQIGKEYGVTSARPDPPQEYRGTDGELFVYKPDHPMAGENGRDGYVRWSYLYAEAEKGRPLHGDEHIVYLDGDPENCTPENVAVVDDDEVHKIRGLQKRKYDEYGAIQALRWLALELGHTPALSDLDDSTINRGIYYRYFDGLKDAARVAGLEPNTLGGGGPQELPDGFRTEYSWLQEEYDSAKEALIETDE